MLFMAKNIKDIRDLAEKLDLSVSTISRVLNCKSDNYRISKATQKRVFEAANKYHYVPNKLARGLKLDKTDTIGLIVPDIADPFFADIAKSIELEARNQRYSLFLCSSGGDSDVEIELISLMLSHKVDGIIIAPVGIDYDHLLKTYKSGVPIILIDRYFPNVELPYVTSDNYQGAYEAVNYLISIGHKRIACIQGIPNSQTSMDRVKGYRDALINNNLPVDKDLIAGDNFNIENGYNQTKILFGMENPPSAILALSNWICLGVMTGLSELELSIPKDVSLIAFDEQLYSAYMNIPMTTIDLKKPEIGRLSAEMLIKWVENKEPGDTVSKIKLKTDFLLRKSVRKY
jgi:LacI family transcriptional regulator